ncbi:hypothetical protein LWP59_13950 [Amycolatopsis acidiphila]|uniref:hypothetical protein n=1 Tax=Amycolatopsis acidiphila TaxID=715473 RepID=UPI0019A7DF6C|nr:hypothetical protein [Amycolatopsis acidiphila]UIJ62652.1 hypothetical protein LWP59_13950 [Amycolatopsis acidiphila]GHG85967.1 hypothetical protein GCM10017788_59090 [Amycolatopsis acidiphila]
MTGTNGNTRTALMLSRILETLGPVAANGDGANMPAGVLAGGTGRSRGRAPGRGRGRRELRAYRRRETAPGLVLLNLSRDQLDRVGEVRATERALRAVVSQLPETTVIANCDDPLVTSAAAESSHPVCGQRTGRGFRQPADEQLVDAIGDRNDPQTPWMPGPRASRAR